MTKQAETKKETAVEVIETLTTEEKKQLANAESRIRNGLKSFVSVGQSLQVIRDNRLYRSNFATFDKYTAEKWDMTRARACQLIQAANIFDMLSAAKVKHLPKTESQCRPFARLADTVSNDEKQGIWESVVAPITASKVNKAVSEFLGEVAADTAADTAEETKETAGETAEETAANEETETKAVLMERLRQANERIAYLETALEAEKQAHRLTIDAKGIALTQTIKAVLKKGIAAYTKGKTIGEVNGLSTEIQELIDIIR